MLQPEDPGYVAVETHGLIAANLDQACGIACEDMGAGIILRAVIPA